MRGYKEMCKKYRLRAKRPDERLFTEWCSTDNYEAIERNIETIVGLGWQWELLRGDQENEGNI